MILIGHKIVLHCRLVAKQIFVAPKHKSSTLTVFDLNRAQSLSLGTLVLVTSQVSCIDGCCETGLGFVCLQTHDINPQCEGMMTEFRKHVCTSDVLYWALKSLHT